jgi:hypothetical protein
MLKAAAAALVGRLRWGAARAPSPFASLPHELLVRLLGSLPLGALAVTPGRVSHAWAAAKADAWAAAVKRDDDDAVVFPYLPAWYVLSVYSEAARTAKDTMVQAACFHGQLDVVAELYAAAREPFGPEACSAAAYGGQRRVLEFLRGRGVPWDTRTFHAAANAGNVPLCEWLLQNGAPWDIQTCSSAASGGQFETLLWLRQNGCPWGEHVAEVARSGLATIGSKHCRQMRMSSSLRCVCSLV